MEFPFVGPEHISAHLLDAMEKTVRGDLGEFLVFEGTRRSEDRAEMGRELPLAIGRSVRRTIA